MPDPYDILEDTLKRTKARGSILRYKPIYPENIEHEKTLGEEYLEKLEEEGDEEEVFKKMMRKGLRRPGTTKATVMAYLARVREKAEKEGRI